MRNITLSADDALIEAARKKARDEQTTLNEKFRGWLKEYTNSGRPNVEAAMELLDRIRSYATTGGRKFTREEMNER
jgi:hypothetical protein